MSNCLLSVFRGGGGAGGAKRFGGGEAGAPPNRVLPPGGSWTMRPPRLLVFSTWRAEGIPCSWRPRPCPSCDKHHLFSIFLMSSLTDYFTLYPNLAIIFAATDEPPSNLLPPLFGAPSDIGGLFCFSCNEGGGAMAAPPDLGTLGFGASSSSSLSCLPANPLNLLLVSSLMYLGLLLLWKYSRVKYLTSDEKNWFTYCFFFPLEAHGFSICQLDQCHCLDFSCLSFLKHVLSAIIKDPSFSCLNITLNHSFVVVGPHWVVLVVPIPFQLIICRWWNMAHSNWHNIASWFLAIG